MLINQILGSYVNFRKPFHRCRNIYFSRDLLARIFNNINDEQLGKLAEEHVDNELKEQMNMLGLQFSIESFLEGVQMWCDGSGFQYRYDETYEADVYTIRFDLGPNWSMFFAKVTHALIDDLKIRNTEIQVTNNPSTLKFKDKRECNPKWVAST